MRVTASGAQQVSEYVRATLLLASLTPACRSSFRQHWIFCNPNWIGIGCCLASTSNTEESRGTLEHCLVSSRSPVELRADDLALSDIYHSYLSLAALALGRQEAALAELDPAWNVSKKVKERMRIALDAARLNEK